MLNPDYSDMLSALSDAKTAIPDPPEISTFLFAGLQSMPIVFQVGVVPRRIDLLTSLAGIRDFDEAWEDHIEVEVDGHALPVLSKHCLIKNKRALGRPQDLADVAWLEAASSNPGS